jgi:hypothetical protein
MSDQADSASLAPPVAEGSAADVARLSKKRRTLYRKLALASLSLLFAGFVLQLAGTLGYGTVAVTFHLSKPRE